MQTKIYLQKHRLKAFYKTLILIENKIFRDQKFLTDYADVYHFPKVLTQKNLATYRQKLKAIKVLKQGYDQTNSDRIIEATEV